MSDPYSRFLLPREITKALAEVGSANRFWDLSSIQKEEAILAKKVNTVFVLIYLFLLIILTQSAEIRNAASKIAPLGFRQPSNLTVRSIAVF